MPAKEGPLPKNHATPAFKLERHAILVLLGVAVGSLGVYFFETGAVGTAAGGTCAFSQAQADAINDDARGEVAALTALDRPFVLRDLSFRDEGGEPVSFALFEDRTILVNLWATWCVPCREEMPALDQLENIAGSEDFAVVPVSVDLGQPDKSLAFYEEAGLSELPFFHDGTMSLFNELRREGIAFGMPVTILADGAGCARGVMNGPAEWASPDALRLVESAIRVQRAGP